MSILQHRFGETILAKIGKSKKLGHILVDPWLESETIIIKPNWVSYEPASFTDSDALRTLFEVLNSRIVVTESLNPGRSQRLLQEETGLTIGNKDVNWRWFLRGDGWKWLIENPSWDWVRKSELWNMIKKADRAFLDDNGFSDLFKEFNVRYINVTNEVWNKRIADPSEVKRIVESSYSPIQIEKLYSMIPKALYDLRGATFISFAKLKMYATFTLKNLFGMIADPIKPWWHGPKDVRIARSIVDINKIYHSLFNVYGICEALNTLAIPHPEGKFTLYLPPMKYNIREAQGFVAFGRDLVSLDAILLTLTEGLIYKIPAINIEPIDLAAEEFGAYDRKILKEAKRKIGNWIDNKSKV